MSINEFKTPEEASENFPEIIPIFIDAFAGEPWLERSKCVDSFPQRCLSGLSSTAIGAFCNTCENVPTDPAYDYIDLAQEFRDHAKSRPTVWYTESIDTGIALAGFASSHSKDTLIEGTYSRSPEMYDWLDDAIGDNNIAWIHELFADASKRSSGNLANFDTMCQGFIERIGGSVLAYCTINDRMVSVAKKHFGENAHVFEKEIEVPDRRDFVMINLTDAR